MAAATIASFVDGVLQSQLLEPAQCDELRRIQANFADTRELALDLLRRNWLTAFQINQILQGKGAGLTIGPFVLLQRVGEGGMGQVFKALQKVLNRVVALKVIRKQCLGNPKVILRFMREIRAAGQLSHPHIVRAYDADQVNGTYYIAMEYIDGVDLARLVKEQGPLPVDQACEYIRQAALGLQHAFERGMVHRDIKPANLLVTRAIASDRRRSSGLIPRPTNLPPKGAAPPASAHAKSSGQFPRIDAATPSPYPWGVVKILDMGLARCTDPFTGQTATHLTQIGSVMGTPEYIAPEQARNSHTSDIRADLYSLGCTLYFLLTGHPPFPHGTMTEKLLQHQLDAVPSVADARRNWLLSWQGTDAPPKVDPAILPVPVAVDAIVRRLLAKRPEDRFETPTELANELQTVLQQLAGDSQPHAPIATPLKEEIIPVEVVEPGSTTIDIAPVHAAVKRSHANRLASKVALVMASLGGLAFITVATVVAALMSRGSQTQASVVEPDPVVKPSEEPTWKRTLRNAIQKKASWEEARQEVLKHRFSYANAAQARQLDDLLLKMPTPFDALDRAKFDVPLPPDMPAEVVGVYGFSGVNVNKPVTSLAVSANGRWLATSEDNGIRLFDLLGTNLPYKIVAHNGRVHQVALSPDGRLVASASEDGTVRVWDVLSRNRVQTFDKHKAPVTRIAFNHDGTQIASGGRDGSIRLWDPRTAVESRRFDHLVGEVRTLAFSNEGREILWGGNTQEVRWAAVKGAAAGSFETRLPMQRVLAIQPQGNLVVVGGNQGLLHVCAFDGKSLTEKTRLKEHVQVNQVAFAPSGKSFIAVGADPTVTVWDAGTLKEQKRWNTLRTPGLSAAFSPDSRHFVIGAAQNQVLVLRLANHDLDALKAALEP